MSLKKKLKFSATKKYFLYQWIEIAYALDVLTERLSFSEGEIWLCHFGLNVGHEQMGKGNDFLRPGIIVKKFYNDFCWIVPLTHNNKATKYYHRIKFENDNKSSAVLSQMRAMDAQRLYQLVGRISERDLRRITEKLRTLI